MNYFLTTMLDFQPIVVGAGCLALGFFYGRHRRAMDQQPQQTAAGSFLEKSDQKLCNSSSGSVQPFHQSHPETHDEKMTRGPASSPTTPRMKTKMAAFENDDDDDDGRSRSSEESSPGEEDIIAADTRQQERCTTMKRHLAQQVVDVLDRHSSGMKQKSRKLIDVKKLGNKLQDLTKGEEDQPWISHSSSHNQGFKYINLVSSENHQEESDELLHRSWKTRTHQRSVVLSPAACTKKVDRDGVGDRKKEEKCLGALATAILANDCYDHDQYSKFPAWDDRSRDDTQGGSIQETSDSENSDFEVDSERGRLGTEAMRTLLSNIEEFVDSSEAPLKQIQIYSKKETGTTRRILLDNEAMTETPSEAPLKQTPVNRLPLQTKKVMQCEYWNQKKFPPSSSSLAAMDITFPSAAPIYELPIECLQEPEGIRSSTELRQPTLLSANDAVEGNSLELSEMEIRSAPPDKTIQKSEKYELLGNAHCGKEHGRRNCAEDLDWDNHPALRDIKLCDRRSYRQQRLCQWLESECARRYGEDFASYLQRSYTLAYNYLRNVNRMHYGDEYPHLLDKFVYQLFTGSRMRQLKIGMLRDVETEELLLQFLREECNELVQEKALAIDPRKFNLPVTPPWPDPAEMARFERIKIPPQLTTLAEMDSR